MRKILVLKVKFIGRHQREKKVFAWFKKYFSKKFEIVMGQMTDIFLEIKKNNVEIQNFPAQQYRKFAEKGLAAVRTVIEPEVGKETWNIVMELRKNALKGKITALEIMKKRKFIR